MAAMLNLNGRLLFLLLAAAHFVPDSGAIAQPKQLFKAPQVFFADHSAQRQVCPAVAVLEASLLRPYSQHSVTT